MFEECFGDGPFVFRINESGAGPQLLAQVSCKNLYVDISRKCIHTNAKRSSVSLRNDIFRT